MKIRSYTDKYGRITVKTRETFKGVTWICTGVSRKSPEEAYSNWEKNREARITKILGISNRKEGRVLLKHELLNWYDKFLRRKAVQGRPRAATTIETDLGHINQICLALGNLNVCDIDADIIQGYLNDLSDKGLSKSTISRRRSYLTGFFKYARPNDNPMALCHMPLTDDVAAMWDAEIEEEDQYKTAFSDDEMLRITDVLTNSPKGKNKRQTIERGNMLAVILWEFLRVGEAVELRVKDIDFDSDTIYVRRQYQEYTHTVSFPKDNSKRKVPISSKCREILVKACKDKSPDDLVFEGNRDNEHGGRVLRRALRNTLAAACKDIGAENHGLHDLRHDGISYIVRHGAKAPSVQKWAGHKSIRVTLDIYYRPTKEDDRNDRAIMTGVT